MSAFLGYESFLIPLGASIPTAHNTIRDAYSTRGWQIVTDNSGVTPTILEIIPPTTETIGGNGSYEILRINVSATTIAIRPIKKWVVGLAQQVYIKESTPGAVTASCTLNGVTVSYTGTSGNTAIQNLMGLYAAIRNSADPAFTGWTWEVDYPAAQNADDNSTYIFGINNTIEANQTFTVSNVVGGILGNYVAPGTTTPTALLGNPQNLTIDLASGFIYFLQVNARGTALGTKTNLGYFGPVHACYAKNSAAMAYLPIDNKFVTPIELVVGYDGAANTEEAYGFTANCWMIPAVTAALRDPAVTSFNLSTIGMGVRRHRFSDAIADTFTQANTSSYGPGWGPITLRGSGIFYSTQSVGNDFQIQRVKTIGTVSWNNGNLNAPMGNTLQINPGIEIEDWFKFVGTGTQEGLVLIADTITVTSVSSIYTPGDTVINLTDASLFQSAGFIVIGNEAIKYTGKTGNQLTGVTGGEYATPQNFHFPGDNVGQGLWFVIINGGAIFAGYAKPV